MEKSYEKPTIEEIDPLDDIDSFIDFDEDMISATANFLIGSSTS